jgi:hypothetical protein
MMELTLEALLKQAECVPITQGTRNHITGVFGRVETDRAAEKVEEQNFQRIYHAPPASDIVNDYFQRRRDAIVRFQVNSVFFSSNSCCCSKLWIYFFF